MSKYAFKNQMMKWHLSKTFHKSYVQIFWVYGINLPSKIHQFLFLTNVLENVVYEQLLAIDVRRNFLCEKTAYTSLYGHPFIYIKTGVAKRSQFTFLFSIDL